MNNDELATYYEKYRHALLVSATRILGDQDWAEDLVQSTFVHLLFSSFFSDDRSYDPKKSAPLTWLTNVVNRRCLNALRDDRVNMGLQAQGGAHLSAHSNYARAPDAALEAYEAALTRDRQLEQLPELIDRDTTIDIKIRLAIESHYLKGVDLETVAKGAGMSRRTLTRRMREALDTWKERLEDGIYE